MKSTLLSNVDNRREWALILDAGDEVIASLTAFANQHHLNAAHFSAIGAFAEVTVGWFDLAAKKYLPIPIREQVEVISLLGDVADSEGKPALHAHVCVARRDGSAHGGHLLHGIVRPTLEVMLAETPAHLRETFRPDFGIALIDPAKSVLA